MKKYIINAIASLLLIFSLYSLYYYVPGIMRTFDPSRTIEIPIIIAIMCSLLLFIITSVGLFMKKSWSTITYWIAIVLMIAVAKMGVANPLMNLYIFSILNIIIAIFLTKERTKLSNS